MDLSSLAAAIIAALNTAKETAGAYSVLASAVETAGAYEAGTVAHWWADLAARSDVIAALQAGGWNFHSSGTVSRFYR